MLNITTTHKVESFTWTLQKAPGFSHGDEWGAALKEQVIPTQWA
jgi:hypothetical protein